MGRTIFGIDTRLVALTFFLLGVFGLVHQKLIGGGWFNWPQVLELRLHQEHLILLCFIVVFLIAVRARLVL